MVKISVTYTRPSVSVPWHFEVIDMAAVDALSISEDWVGKHEATPTSGIYASGAGSTTLDANVVWASAADFTAFQATAEYQAYAAARDSYNAANGITAGAQTVTSV